MIIIGFIIALSLFSVGIILAGDSPLIIVNIPCVIIIIFTPLVLMIFNGYVKFFILGFRIIFKPLKTLSNIEVQNCISIFDFLIKMTIKSSWVGIFIGLVLIAANLFDIAAMGPGISIVLISPLYGLVFSYFLYYPIKHKLEFIRIGKE